MEPTEKAALANGSRAGDEDYIFRFALDAPPPSSDDPLADLVRSFVAGFLEIGCFTRNGRPVVVDGFRLNGREGVVELFAGPSRQVGGAPGRP